MPKVQIDRDLLEAVYYALQAHDRDPTCQTTQKTLSIVYSHVSTKIQAIERRDAYTAYKRAEPGTPEREQHRNKYLDFQGTSRDWRTTTEHPNP
jgi:hypothetical protein